ncbi:hypothetical protein T492DRAFT_1152660 [Pavlovales sp. CCMP2436]|nr:hypothetical protein T492DRAFT_1152660 [Pavlovales sp. CCMP2436]
MVAHYEIYLQNWRNLQAQLAGPQFLESELDKMHQGEQAGLEAHERQMRAMQRQLREEELRVLRGQADASRLDEQAIDNAMLNEGPTNFEDEYIATSIIQEEEDERVSQRAVKRPGGAGARRGKGRSGVGDGRMGGNFVGSMNPAEDEGEESSSFF